MKLAKLVILVAVAVLLTGGPVVAEEAKELIIKISQPNGPGTELKIDVQNAEDWAGFPGASPGIPNKAKEKMDNKLFKMRDTAIVIISNPCGWVYANGKWYWRCW